MRRLQGPDQLSQNSILIGGIDARESLAALHQHPLPLPLRRHDWEEGRPEQCFSHLCVRYLYFHLRTDPDARILAYSCGTALFSDGKQV
jgi:hypothetical protein